MYPGGGSGGFGGRRRRRVTMAPLFLDEEALALAVQPNRHVAIGDLSLFAVGRIEAALGADMTASQSG
jgi:hypothetical protein